MQQKERKERRKEEREGERESREGGIEGRKFKNIPGIWFLHYTRNRHAYFNCIGQVLSSLRLILSPRFFTVYDVPSLKNNLKRNHCAVRQKLTPHCKSTILHQQLKKKKLFGSSCHCNCPYAHSPITTTTKIHEIVK